MPIMKMMDDSTKRCQLILTLLSKDGKTVQLYERVEGHSMTELLAKFQLTIIRAMEELKKEELDAIRGTDDDIPF